MKDARGLRLSYDVQGVVQKFEEGFLSALSFEQGALDGLRVLSKENPSFLFLRITVASFDAFDMQAETLTRIAKELEVGGKHLLKANARELEHLQALQLWSEASFGAAIGVWRDIVTSFPKDLLAIHCLHLAQVRTGRRTELGRDEMRALRSWDSTLPGYAFVLGYQSFGLEENGHYGSASDTAEEALSFLGNHPYAIHTLAHIHEMVGSRSIGINFLDQKADNWRNTTLSHHIWWHLTLHHIDRGNWETVLSIYDKHLSPRLEQNAFRDQDAAAVLWRLELAGVSVGSRWQPLANSWENRESDGLFPFNDLHAMLAFVGAGLEDAQTGLISCRKRRIVSDFPEDPISSGELVQATCEAFRAFASEEYNAAASALAPLNGLEDPLGGSVAQRDIIPLTYLEALHRAARHEEAVTQAVVRCMRSPESPTNYALLARSQAALGRLDDEAKSKRKAEELLAS